MKRMFFMLASAGLMLASCGENTPKLGISSIDDVLAAMTLEEKVHLIVGTGMAGQTGDRSHSKCIYTLCCQVSCGIRHLPDRENRCFR